MGVGEGMGKVLGIGALVAGAIGVIWLYRDKIANWFWQSAGQPIQQATAPVAEAVNQPIPGTGGAVSPADVARALVPGVGIGSIWGMIQRGWETISGPSSPAPVSDTFVSAPQTIPTEADILWQAKLAEVGPVPSGPAPSGYMVRGSSITGAPLYAPVQQMIGTIPIPDAPGTVGEVWQLGPSRLVRIGDVWLGENISACYLSGGLWDAPRGRCVYA